MNKPIDDKNVRRTKAQKGVSDGIMSLVETITNLETVTENESYQRGFDDGVAWLKEEFKRVAKGNDDQEPVKAAPYVLTEVDRIMNESIVSYITDTPGLRTIDITNKVVALPVKPVLTEKVIRLAINRLKNTGKIEDKAGRWYMTGAKALSPDYQVMRYLPDGSKYLGSDIIR
jgi:hypothetical protein